MTTLLEGGRFTSIKKVRSWGLVLELGKQLIIGQENFNNMTEVSHKRELERAVAFGMGSGSVQVRAGIKITPRHVYEACNDYINDVVAKESMWFAKPRVSFQKSKKH